MTAFGRAWGSVRKIDMERLQQAQTVEAMTVPDTMVDLNVKTDGDQCCIDATEKYAEAFTDWVLDPPGPLRISPSEEGDLREEIRDVIRNKDCDRIRYLLEDDLGPADAAGGVLDQHDIRFEERKKQILEEWDACAERGSDWSGDFTASEDSFNDAWGVVKMPARDRRYTVTADDVKRMQELSEQGMSQAAIQRVFVDEGIPVTQGIVHYWVNEASRMKQRGKNAKRTYIPGTPEDTLRIQRDQEKRRKNWEADPDMRLRHNIQSAMDENRWPRHTVQGMTMEEAEVKMRSGELKRPNAKIPEEDEI